MGVFNRPTASSAEQPDIDIELPENRDPDKMTKITDSTPGRDYNTLRASIPRSVEKDADLEGGESFHFFQVDEDKIVIEVVR